jgi:hypothetical protein
VERNGKETFHPGPAHGAEDGKWGEGGRGVPVSLLHVPIDATRIALFGGLWSQCFATELTVTAVSGVWLKLTVLLL